MPMHLATVLFILFHMLPLFQFTGTAGGRLHYGKGTCHSGSGNKGATCTPTYICSDAHTSTWKKRIRKSRTSEYSWCCSPFCRSQCKRLWWYRRIKDCFRSKPWRYTHSSSLRWSGCEQHPSGTNRYRTFCIGWYRHVISVCWAKSWFTATCTAFRFSRNTFYIQ